MPNQTPSTIDGTGDVPTDPRERHIWITAALRIAGSSFAAIARELQVTPQHVQMATLRNSWRPQEAIARKIGVPAHVLFPEWHDESGARYPRGPRCDRSCDRNVTDNNVLSDMRNVEAGEAA